MSFTEVIESNLLMDEIAAIPPLGLSTSPDREPSVDEFLALWRDLQELWATRVAMELLDEFDAKRATSFTYEGDS